LGSRIFPGNSPRGGSRTNAVLIERFRRGSDFRFVLGNSTALSRPWPCPAPRVQ
jgi:hypothetical protein